MPDTPDRPPLTDTQAESQAHLRDADRPDVDDHPIARTNSGGTTFVSVFAVTAFTLALIIAPFFLFRGLDGQEDGERRVADSTQTVLAQEQDTVARRLETGGLVRDTSGRVIGRTLAIDSAMALLADPTDSTASDVLTAR